MTWPEDMQMQMQALATFAGDTIGKLQADGEAAALASVLSDLRLGAWAHKIDPDKLASHPEVRRFLEEEAHRRLKIAQTSIREDVFTSVGGVSTLAIAPGSDAIVSAINRIACRETLHVGRAMCIAVELALYHQDLPASINRVWSIMEAEIGARRYTGPGDRSAFLKLWSKWQFLAPLFAARSLFLQLTADRGAPPEITLKLLASEEGVTQILGWTQWFRRWGSTYQSPRARDTFLRPAGLASYETIVPEIEPPLKPLCDHQLAAARAYLAPTSKFNM